MYKLDDVVEIKRGKAKGLKGPIVEIERIFKEIDTNGRFEEDGLLTLESTIPMCKIPYEFDGETLKVHFPESDYGNFIQKAYTKVSKFYDYGYTIQAEGKGHRVLVSSEELA